MRVSGHFHDILDQHLTLSDAVAQRRVWAVGSRLMSPSFCASFTRRVFVRCLTRSGTIAEPYDGGPCVLRMGCRHVVRTVPDPEAQQHL